jgi:hypothetical protein
MEVHEGTPAATRYEILVAGEFGAAATEMFAGLEIFPEDDITVITADVDQAALHGLLERVRTIGLELVEVHRVRGDGRPVGRDAGTACTVTNSLYEIRVVGALGPAAREAFAGLAIDVETTSTLISGDLEQADLHALLDRVRALHLELVEVRHRQGHPSRPPWARPLCPSSGPARAEPIESRSGG